MKRFGVINCGALDHVFVARYFMIIGRMPGGPVDKERACASILPFELIPDKEHEVQNTSSFEYINKLKREVSLYS